MGEGRRRPSVVASTIGVWPMISRTTLSEAAFTVSSGSRMSNRYFATSPIFHRTTKLTSMMFSSPVRISASSATSRTGVTRMPGWAEPERKPTSIRLTRATWGLITSSTGQGRW